MFCVSMSHKESHKARKPCCVHARSTFCLGLLHGLWGLRSSWILVHLFMHQVSMRCLVGERQCCTGGVVLPLVPVSPYFKFFYKQTWKARQNEHIVLASSRVSWKSAFGLRLTNCLWLKQCPIWIPASCLPLNMETHLCEWWTEILHLLEIFCSTMKATVTTPSAVNAGGK